MKKLTPVTETSPAELVEESAKASQNVSVAVKDKTPVLKDSNVSF